MLWALEYSRPSAVKMLRVPRVTMNGGSLNRVTSTPLRRPPRVPTAKPASRASQPGQPCSADSFAITIMARMVSAPTDRSMPAVRMMSVCPMASAATTATCCRTSERDCGLENRELIEANTMKETMSTSRG